MPVCERCGDALGSDPDCPLHRAIDVCAAPVEDGAAKHYGLDCVLPLGHEGPHHAHIFEDAPGGGECSCGLKAEPVDTMSDEVRNVESLEQAQQSGLPPMTEGDIRVLIQLLTSATMLGATRIEFHPARWKMLLDNLLHHGAYPANKLHWLAPMEEDAADYERVAVPLIFTVGDGLLTCMLMQRPQGIAREKHEDEGEYAEILDTQGSIYPKPDEMTEEEKMEARAREAGIVLPFKPKVVVPD